jgi:hypothetical protein
MLGGIHLAWCALHPEQLVHLTVNGGHAEGVHVDIGEWHAVEVVAGGLGLAVLSAHLFLAALRKESDTPPPPPGPP